MVAGLAGIIVVVLLGVYWRDIAAWVKFVSLFESIGRNEQGYLEYRHRQTGIVIVRVPGGTFMMGSPEGEIGPLEETPKSSCSGKRWRHVPTSRKNSPALKKSRSCWKCWRGRWLAGEKTP